MGIRHLNRFFRENAADGMKVISLSELSGKKIAVDISIYMHKYAAEDTLIESMYSMLSIFRHYNITPIFVFDGKPPAEKKELLVKRREDRKAALCEYDKLKELLANNEDMENIEKQEIQGQMDILKRNFIQIKKNDVECVKDLIRAYGATYYDAPGEADELCALLAIKGKVWATLSEDMDMFVYGCPYVIRYMSLLNHTTILYDLKSILQQLGITQKELREICILSGTDYNSMNDADENKSHNLHSTLKLFKKYLKEKKADKNWECDGFYQWLLANTDYIEDYNLLTRIYDMFDLTNNHVNVKVFETIRIANGPIIQEDIHEILKTDGFLFPPLLVQKY
jgi:5'-3' exonuclease